MAIVRNFTDFATPDVFLREAEPTATARGAGIGVVGAVLQATRGPVNVSTTVASLSDFVRKFGAYDKNLSEGFMFVRNLFLQGASVVKVVRVTDGAEKAASGTMTGAASGTVFSLTTAGTWGNNVVVDIAASSVAGYVDLTFRNGSQEVYNYPQVTFTSTTDDRYFKDIIENSGDEFITVVTAGTVNPSTGSITFSGGVNGTVSGASVLDTAYIGTTGTNGPTGLAVFEGDDEVNFVVSARSNAVVNAGLIAHVALATIKPRMAIIAPPQGTTVDGIVTMMSSINNDQVVMTYPWLQILNPYNNKKEYHSPVSFYSGLLSTLSYEQSPSRQQINGVIGTERALTNAEVDRLSTNRISPITLLPGLGFVIRNGYNTSSTPSKQNITRRRAVNFFAKSLEAASQQFVSRPHTQELRTDVKSAFGSMIEREYGLGRIGNVNGGKPYAVKCDADNNPDTVVRANRLMVDVQISLLAPADFILVTLDASEAKVITLS